MSYLSQIAGGGFDASAEASDTVPLAKAAQGLYVGGTGNVKGMLGDGSILTFSGVPAGVTLPFLFKQIFDNGTTATLLIGCRKT